MHGARCTDAQAALEQARHLAPDEEVAFNWRSHRGDQLLEIALSEEPAAGGAPAREAARKSKFSHGFRLDEVRAARMARAWRVRGACVARA